MKTSSIVYLESIKGLLFIYILGYHKRKSCCFANSEVTKKNVVAQKLLILREEVVVAATVVEALALVYLKTPIANNKK
ncbi:MAG: hypothetical protein VX278_12005 [Myxococcota bacterium]|nr:hypothetical protein [Myxococcota bacterium]